MGLKFIEPPVRVKKETSRFRCPHCDKLASYQTSKLHECFAEYFYYVCEHCIATGRECPANEDVDEYDGYKH